MGRPRSFDTAAVVRLARDAFVRGGYRSTSVDDLLTATGIQRASLYSAFGSKRGLFLAALRARPLADDPDLLLVALMEAAADDTEIGDLAAAAADVVGDEALGRHLRLRAVIDGRRGST